MDTLDNLLFERALLLADKATYFTYIDYKITGEVTYTNVQRDLILTIKRNLSAGTTYAN